MTPIELIKSFVTEIDVKDRINIGLEVIRNIREINKVD